MSNSTEPAKLSWNVTFGAVFRAKIDGRSALWLSLRMRDGKWADAHNIQDPGGIYKNLGIDQIAFATVRLRADERSLKDMFTATFNEGGDSTSIARAVKGNIFSALAENVFREQMSRIGPIVYVDGTPTILYQTMLHGYFDPADFDALRKAYAQQTVPDEDAAAYAEVVAAFNDFLDKFDAAQGDELYWFDYVAPVASRSGYVILRAGRAFAVKVAIMP
jgi:hypothetical protein